MTESEKAKAYDEALDRAIELYEKDSVFDSEKTLIMCIFPELKESEDEKAKRIILALPFKHEADYKFVKTWLEKQGEPRQEWSEEDEKMANDLIEGCILCISSEKSYHIAHTSKEIADWLKSLKDRVKGKED